MYGLTIMYRRQHPDFPETTSTPSYALVIKCDFHEACGNSNLKYFVYDGITAALCTIHF